ncbi:MAG: OmpA family protein [Labilithrix sp.]
MSAPERVPGEDLPIWAAGGSGIAGVAAAVAAVLVFAQGTAVASAPPIPSPRMVVAAAAPPPPPPAPPAASSAAPSAPPPSAPSAPAPCTPLVVPFTLASFSLASEERERLGKIGRSLAKRPEVTLLLHGHADALGSDEGNLSLSRMRAQAVASELMAAGVPRARITVRGFGAYQPVEGAPEEAASNRRVVVYLREADACVSAEGRVEP